MTDALALRILADRQEQQMHLDTFKVNSPFWFIAELLTESFNAVPVCLSV